MENQNNEENKFTTDVSNLLIDMKADDNNMLKFSSLLKEYKQSIERVKSNKKKILKKDK